MKSEATVCRVCGTPISADSDRCPVCALRAALADDDLADGLSAESSPLSELRFGHYEVLTHKDGLAYELGRGSMGVTYKAVDVDLQRAVALKVIAEQYLGDESTRLRFIREARAAASVRHPNVASVFHLGKSGEIYFYAMEFVEGETLESLIKKSGRLEVKLALEITTQVAAGLSAINKQNLVHRDIKPSNIMVSFDADGRPATKIVDLGLAKPLTQSSSGTAISIPGAFAGTPEFASPEQFTGIGVDIRSDLYSLGATLWQMLSGQPPFRGAVQEVMQQHQQAPLPLEQLSEVPPQAVTLLEILLKKNPARRFQTPGELLVLLPTVRDAIETGRRMVKTIRVFVSSTSDVQTERNLADRVIHSIAAEFDLLVNDSDVNFQRLAEVEPDDQKPETSRDERQKLMLCPRFSNSPGSEQTEGYRAKNPDRADIDLLISIIWSRLGNRSDPMLKMPDGSAPGSGAEYEIAWALEHAGNSGGVPVLQVYRNCSKPVPPLEPKEQREAFGREWDAVQEFFAHWGSNAGKLTGKVDNYHNLEEFEALFRRQFRDFLISRLEEELGQKISSRRVRRWKASPFRGLNVFDFEHAPIFYGRTRAVGEVLEALEQQRRAQRPFVLVVGASGSGKSSLIRAGVVPLLAQPGTIEGINLWRRAVTRPAAGGTGSDCFDALAAALLDPVALPELGDPESLNPIRDLATQLREHSNSVALRIQDALEHAARESRLQQLHYLKEREQRLCSLGRSEDARRVQKQIEALPPAKARLALVLDQLEELFTSAFSPDLQRNYIFAITKLARSGRVFVMAALRSDFYPSYQDFQELTELTRPSGKIDLRPPTPHEIGRMIRLPAEAAGLKFEQDQQGGQRLDEALRDDAVLTPESLPLLEHVLSLLYEKQAARGDHILRWSDYRELGELKGALAKHAETVFGTSQPDEQEAFPLVMRYLVTLGQSEEEVPNRRTVPYRDFSGTAGAKGFVDRFIEQRLLVAGTDPQGETTVSVAHEALLREWQRVKDWLAENREFLRMRDRLDSSLKLWRSRNKQKDDLLGPGLPLAEGEKLVKDFGPSLSRGQKEFVEASIAEQKRRQRIHERIRYGVMAGISAALVAALIFGVVSYRQYRRAERARNDAQNLINFMTIDLRDKLQPIGRLEPLKDVAKHVLDYYDQLPASERTAEVQRQKAIAIANYADIRTDLGDKNGALETYAEAVRQQSELVKLNPKNTEWQHDLSATLDKMGDTLGDQGKIQEALEKYDHSSSILEKLASLEPGNLSFQHDLSNSLERRGELLKGKGDIAGALKHYEKSLRTREKLAAQHPDDVGLQRDLAWSYTGMGEIFSVRGDFDESHHYYESALDIRRRLAGEGRDDAILQRELSACLDQFGYELMIRGDLDHALDAYSEALVIAGSLVFKDPSNALYKRDLSITLDGVGDALTRQGKNSNALMTYKDSLWIRQQLSNRDDSSSQHELSESYREVGDALLAQRNSEKALENYRESLAIAERLVESDHTNNNQWQSDLAVVYEKTGEAFAAKGDFKTALDYFRESLNICEKLTKVDSHHVQWLSDEAQACFRIGISMARPGGRLEPEARNMLLRAQDILVSLKQRSALGASDQGRLEEIRAMLGKF